ncbi:MAG TPA: hypothetical protein VGK77_23975 [Candidatus Binatia bacterium]|jgi:hypothetical protein
MPVRKFLLGLVQSFAAVVQADASPPFYEGKTIRFIVVCSADEEIEK